MSVQRNLVLSLGCFTLLIVYAALHFRINCAIAVLKMVSSKEVCSLSDLLDLEFSVGVESLGHI